MGEGSSVVETHLPTAVLLVKDSSVKERLLHEIEARAATIWRDVEAEQVCSDRVVLLVRVLQHVKVSAGWITAEARANTTDGVIVCLVSI